MRKISSVSGFMTNDALACCRSKWPPVELFDRLLLSGRTCECWFPSSRDQMEPAEGENQYRAGNQTTQRSVTTEMEFSHMGHDVILNDFKSVCQAKNTMSRLFLSPKQQQHGCSSSSLWWRNLDLFSPRWTFSVQLEFVLDQDLYGLHIFFLSPWSLFSLHHRI